MIKERPIIMQAHSVRAILSGLKTQTRRVVKSPWQTLPLNILEYKTDALAKCPYGNTGDLLWVREAWCGKIDSATNQVAWREDGNAYDCWYAASDPDVMAMNEDGFIRRRKDGSEASPWRSPLFMPRWASRITLEITDVRLERLIAISDPDCRAEGVVVRDPPNIGYMCAKDAFEVLWRQINGSLSWESNPWVWAITFRIVVQRT